MAAIGTFTGFDGAGSGEDLAVFAPYIWIPKVNMFFKEKLVMARFFTDLSSEFAGGAIAAYVPNFTAPSATAKTNGAVVTLNSPTETAVTLTVDTWVESSYLIEKKEMHQVAKSYNLMNRYAEAAGYAVAEAYDTTLAALLGGFTQTVGSSTATLVDSDIRTAINYLANQNADLSQCAFFFHPNEVWGDLLALDKYTSFDFSSTKPLNGEGLARQAGVLYGIPVYETTNIQVALGSRLGALAHKDAIIHATLYGVQVDSNYIPMYMGQLITADLTYGAIENRDLLGVTIKSSS